MFLLLLINLLSMPAFADSQLRSNSAWQVEDNIISTVFTISKEDGKQLLIAANKKQANFSSTTVSLTGSTKFLEILAKNIELLSLANNCLLSGNKVLLSANSHFRFKLSYQCESSVDEVTINFESLIQVFATHVHLAKVVIEDSERAQHVLSSRNSQFNFSANSVAEQSGEHSNKTLETAGSTFINYLLLGYEHILIGSDHIAFILALLLLVSGFKNISFLITGFTLGHMLTLSLMTLNVVTPNALWVESLIGFSIALIACEAIIAKGSLAKPIALFGLFIILALALLLMANLMQNLTIIISLFGLMMFYGCYLLISEQQNHRLLWQVTITFLFGLIHGFGFAGVLSEIGLPQEDIFNALLGFNLGVELGQLSIVVFVCYISKLTIKLLPISPQASVMFSQVFSSLLCGLGVYWFVSRTLVFI